LYWGQNRSPLNSAVIRLEPNGTTTIFANSSSSAAVGEPVLAGGFVHWLDSGYRRASTAAAVPVVNAERLGAGTLGSNLIGAVGNCVYGNFGSDTTVSTNRQIERACTGGMTALVYTGNDFIGDIVADATGVYFSENGAGVKRISLNSDRPTITTVAPLASSTNRPLAMAIDGNFVYFVDGAQSFMDCSTNWTINRVSKNGGPVTPLVVPPIDCPSQIAVDDSFVYFANTGSGRAAAAAAGSSINKVSK
jgi:hypothetical protein